MVRSLICQKCGTGFEAKRSDAKYCPNCRDQAAYDAAMRHEQSSKKPCPECGKVLVTRRAKRCYACDREWRRKAYPGGDNPYWKGGRTIDKFGYILLRVEVGTHKGGARQYVREHRLVWEQAHGPLPSNYIIHHLNGIKSDNRLENLAAMSRSAPHAGHAEPYEARIRKLEAKLAELQQQQA